MLIFDYIRLIAEGIAIGFMASVPLGPIGVICIQRTLSGSRMTGFVSGMGAATADTIFAVAAIFSLSLVTSFIDTHIHWLKVIGGILVIILGLTIFYKRVGRTSGAKRNTGNMVSNYLSVLFLTLTNPSYILIFVALFAAVGINNADSPWWENLFVVAGVFAGAGTWWFTLTWLINLLRKKFTLRHIWWINKITGSLIVVIGAFVILSLIIKLPDSVWQLLDK